jgi:hypothetical protein
MNESLQIKDATIIVQSTNMTAPHLETELEIIECLLSQNNSVYWLQCNIEMKNCFYNPENNYFRCLNCKSKVKNSEKILKFHNNKNLHVITYNDFIKKSSYKTDLPSIFENHEELKQLKYKGCDIGLACFSSLVTHTRDHLPNLTTHKDYIARGIETGAYIYDCALEMMTSIKPNLVILFNGRFLENRPLLRAAQSHKIDYATHEKGGRLQTFLFRENTIPHSVEAVTEEIEKLWQENDPNKIEIGNNFFIKKTKGVEDAWFSFTKEQKEGLLPSSIGDNKLKNKKIITIFNSSLDEYEGLEGFGPYFYDNDNVAIENIARDLVPFENLKLYLRVHPNLKNINNSQNTFIKEIIGNIPSIEVINAEDSIDSYALMRESDIIIVFGSTVGIEAAVLNKKVILLGRAAYENLNCCYIPKNHADLIEMLSNDNYPFEKLDTSEAVKFGYWNETFGISHINYEPTGFNSGKYRGKKIKANFLIRKMKQITKS